MTGTPRLRVTVSGNPEPSVRAEAMATADRLGVPFVERRAKAPLHRLLEAPDDVLLVFERDEVSLWDQGGHFRWSPGLASLRVMTFERGEGDTLVWAAGLTEGDEVLDCTLGLGQDALVASRAVGPRGRVTGFEKSLPLHAVVSAGLNRLGALPGACAIEARLEDSARGLAEAPPKSFDVVLFDPMFGRPTKAQPAFEMLRRHADHAPLTPSLLEAAKRVARRAVVVKGARYSDDLKKLGVRPLAQNRYSAVAWARLDCC